MSVLPLCVAACGLANLTLVLALFRARRLWMYWRARAQDNFAPREDAGSELPERDTWPTGQKPRVAHTVKLANGQGGELVLRVRDGAFR
ncbi:MAG: hypothetical protein ACYDC2_10705, partial [Solirubrobacteraceae bacterium]